MFMLTIIDMTLLLVIFVFLPMQCYASTSTGYGHMPVSCVRLSQVDVLLKGMDGLSWFLTWRLLLTYSKFRYLNEDTFLWNFVLNTILRNFCHGVSSSKRVINLTWQRWMLSSERDKLAVCRTQLWLNISKIHEAVHTGCRSFESCHSDVGMSTVVIKIVLNMNTVLCAFYYYLNWSNCDCCIASHGCYQLSCLLK